MLSIDFDPKYQVLVRQKVFFFELPSPFDLRFHDWVLNHAGHQGIEWWVR